MKKPPEEENLKGMDPEPQAPVEEIAESPAASVSDAQAAVEAQLAKAAAEAAEAQTERAVEDSPSLDEVGDPGSESPTAGDRSAGDEATDRYSRNIQRILDLQLPVTVTFGSTERPLAEVLKLVPGAVLELDKWADEPVVLKVNKRVMAWGKVVDVDGYYGVEITDIVARADRIASLGDDA